MGSLRIDQLKKGMVLSGDVRDISGRLLLTKGGKIQPRFIRKLKMWGITAVEVADHETGDPPAWTGLDPERFARATEALAPFFCHTDLEHPAIKELFRIAAIHRSFRQPPSAKRPQLLNFQPTKPIELRKKMLGGSITLPEIPSILFELNEVIADPMVSTERISQVINKSPSLAALLLKIVNSPFYGFPSKIDSISWAVTIIGTREITALAVGITTISNFKDIPSEILEMHSFLRHSFACGVMARILGAHKNIYQTEQLFVSGLLHDIGRLLIYRSSPEQALALLEGAAVSEQLLYEEEAEQLGYRHTDIGRDLIRKWKLPENLENNICHHHDPEKARNPVQAGIIHIADIIVNSLGIGSSGERFTPPLDPQAWETVGLSPDVLEKVIVQSEHQLHVLDSFLQG